jgi:hypothetical protein
MFTRRTFGFGMGLCILFASRPSKAEGETIPISVTLGSEKPYEFPPDAHFQGKLENERTKGAPVIVTVAVGIVLVSYLVDLVFDIYNRVTNGTVLIDLRDGKVSVHNVPGGTLELIVVSDSGVQNFQRSEISRDVVKAFIEKAIGRKT